MNQNSELKFQDILANLRHSVA